MLSNSIAVRFNKSVGISQKSKKIKSISTDVDNILKNYNIVEIKKLKENPNIFKFADDIVIIKLANGNINSLVDSLKQRQDVIFADPIPVKIIPEPETPLDLEEDI